MEIILQQLDKCLQELSEEESEGGVPEEELIMSIMEEWEPSSTLRKWCSPLSTC